MEKQLNINLKIFRRAFLCFAMLLYGVPVTAAMPDHDMSSMEMDHGSDTLMMDGECSSQQGVMDDCCQADECERTCLSQISVILFGDFYKMPIFDVGLYADYISRGSLFDDAANNPPPIS